MPLHMTRWVLDRLSQRWFAGADAQQTSDTTFVDFVNILQHRMIALYYRAWADAIRESRSSARSAAACVPCWRRWPASGFPARKMPTTRELDAVKLRQAAALANQVDGPERLTLFVAEAFKVPVQLKEFVAVVDDRAESAANPAWAGTTPRSAAARRSGRGPSAAKAGLNFASARSGSTNYKSFLPGGKRLVSFEARRPRYGGRAARRRPARRSGARRSAGGADRSRPAWPNGVACTPPMKGAMLKTCVCGRLSDGGRKRGDRRHEPASHA